MNKKHFSSKMNVKFRYMIIAICVLLAVACIAVFIWPGMGAFGQNGQRRNTPKLQYVHLDNGETLDLNWALSKSQMSDFDAYTYNIELYDAQDRLRVTFELNSNNIQTNLNTAASADAAAILTCPASIYVYKDTNASGEADNIRNEALTICAYTGENKDIHILLDQIDVLAAETSEDVTEIDFSNTSSVMRWIKDGIFNGSENIYARVQAVKGDYTSQWVRTQNQNLLMGEGSQPEQNKYTIQNARHLFNVRYMEVLTNGFWSDEETLDITDSQEAQEHTVTYQQTETFAWNTEKYGDFPVIDGLAQNHTLSADHDTEIQNLHISGTGAQNAAGLFAVNDGVIIEIKLTNISVVPVVSDTDDSIRATGAVCGVNYGKIENVSVEGGIICGQDNVGGIAGIWNSPEDVQNLSNSAYVIGKGYVGGIVGKAVNDRSKEVTFKNCSHTGIVSGEEKYVGGIAGYAYGIAFDSDMSSPESIYSLEAADANLKPILENIKQGADYVGGIVGYATKCTIKDTKTEEGLVFGHDYVGGIAGYWTDARRKNIILDGNGASNKAVVQGHDYVGGITSLCQEELTIKNWTNEGYICASGDYAGGITGKNEGIIEDCGNKMSLGEKDAQFLKALMNQYDASGNYVGGIVGLNDGIIRASDKTYVTSVISGENYVGGIVGCNLKEAVVQNYVLADGYVWGSYFVGGYAGLNYAQDLLMQEAIEASPMLVSGTFAVGGVLGANFSVISSPALTVNFVVNNEQGEVCSAGVFTGGMIGMNVPFTRLYYTSDVTPAQKLLETVKNKSSEHEVSWNDIVRAATDTLKFMGTMAGRKYEMTITSSNTSTLWDTNGYVKLDRIKGSVYVGGVVGYNHDRMEVTVKNICDMADIIATDTIVDAGKTAYAYAGSIIGYVNALMTLDHCDFDDSIAITHEGSYKGGIAEVNRGLIRDCDGGQITTDDQQNLGGIVGINQKGGIIHASRQNGNITGTAYTGGIAALNEGVIKNSETKAVVESSGFCVGGIAGMNNGTIKECSVEQDVTAKAATKTDTKADKDLVSASVYVFASGNCVGGIAGYNRGTVTSCSNSSQTISGQYYVGGIVGYQMGSELGKTETLIENTQNHAFVQAYDYAGGIAGALFGKSSITSCTNLAVIEVTEGDLGGIAGYAGAGTSLIRCRNTEDMKAAQAKNLGGIVGKNAGRIEQCVLDDTLQILGSYNVGGIAGENTGTITSVNLASNQITLQGNGSGGNVGGITGINSGTILVCASAADTTKTEAVLRSTVSTNVTESCIGGIAGQNKGTIQGLTQSNEKSSLNVLISVKNDAQVYAGGIVGKNQNTISDYMFSGYIQAPGSAQGALGGIAGKNAGTISNCLLNDLRLNKTSFSNQKVESSWYYTIRVENEAIANVGGITGINESEGFIENSTLRQCYIRVNYGYVGGIAGVNKGSIRDCLAEKTSVADSSDIHYKVKIYVENGYAGGIVGCHEETGIMRSSSSGIDWVVMAAQSVTGSEHKLFEDSAAGGIIGYLYRKSSFRSIRNYAAVVSTDSKNCIIGRIDKEDTEHINSTDNANNGENTDSTGNMDNTGNIQTGGVRQEEQKDAE